MLKNLVRMSHPVQDIVDNRKHPFKNMHIDDHTILDSIEGRFDCKICHRSRKFFCYSCYIPVGNIGNILPMVRLPLKIDIIKHRKEIDGKSTAVHAAVLAPGEVNIFTYPNIPDYTQETDVVLIYPSVKSITVAELFERNVRLCKENNFGLPKGHNVGTLLKKRVQEVIGNELIDHVEHLREYSFENLPIKKAVFIDSTWNQSRGIYKDERMKSLKPIVLQNRCSQFWRHQKGSPRWYLATIEAIHQFLLEVHVNGWGLNANYRGLDHLDIETGFYKTAPLVNKDDNNIEPTAPYNGQYDNLMYFFANMYDLIHKYYKHNELKSYRRPI